MPDVIDEQLREAFVRFQAAARDEIRVPGAGNARHSVARRRRLRLTAGACGLAIVLVAGWATFGNSGGGDGAPIATASPDSADQQDRLLQAALTSVGLDPQTAGDRPTAWWGPGSPGAMSHTFGEGSEPFPAGRYTMVLGCSGAGSFTLTWRTDTATGELVDDCSVPTQPDGQLTLLEPGPVEITVHADPDAIDAAAFAVTISDPWLVLATAAVDETTSPEMLVFGGSGLTTAARHDQYKHMTPGVYRLTVACAGSGRLKASLQANADRDSVRLDCSFPYASVTNVVLTATTSGIGAVTIEQIEGERGSAGFVYRVERFG
jgi:hypothetical protein